MKDHKEINKYYQCELLSTAAACLGKAKNSSKPEKKSGFNDEGLRQKKKATMSVCVRMTSIFKLEGAKMLQYIHIHP